MVSAIIFIQVGSATAWTANVQWNIISLHVAGKVLRFLDDLTSQILDLAHESRSLQASLFHELELIFPFPSQFGRRENIDSNSAEQRDKGDPFRGSYQLLAFARDIFVMNQSFNDRGAGCRRTQ